METGTAPRIKGSELRIGNTVLFSEHIIDILMLNAETIYEYYSATCTDEVIALKDCTGIPLTRELLSKYGYVKEGYNAYKKRGAKLAFSFLGDKVACMVSCSRCRSEVNLTTIQFLHQLQNLVYLLTDVELEMIL